MSEQQNLSEFNRFLINNKDFLIQKHEQYFNGYPQTIKTLQTQSVIDYIYDIFSFNKYRKDLNTHQKISSSLLKNVQHFISENQYRQTEIFTSEVAVQALTYCIQHNDMFSVQYDVQKPHQKEEIPNDQSSIVNEKQKNANSHQIQPNPNIKQSINGKQNTITKTISNKSLAKNEDQIFVNITKLGEAIQNRHSPALHSVQQQDDSKSQLQHNQFDQHHQRISISLHPNILKKNAKLAYDNFCKNQMQLGGRKTFDRLSQEASTMTIGKLLVYAKAYNIFSASITKQELTNRFKKISNGKRSIDFQKFYTLIAELHDIDSQIFNKLQLGDENLHKKLKFVKYPFYTQDQNPREYVAYRHFMNKLTSHSGKTHEELKEQLNKRKHEQMGPLIRLPAREFNNPQRRREDSYLQKQKILSPKDLSGNSKSKDYSIQLSFIDKIVSPEDNDLKYLGEYEILHLRGNSHEAGVISSNNLHRKLSIVDNIRKRIQQIQHIQDSSRKINGSKRY